MDILKEVFEDAKTLKKSTAANVQLVLEEKIMPRLTKLVEGKLSEALYEDDELDYEDEEDEVEESVDLPIKEAGADEPKEDDEDEDVEAEDAELEEILRELEASEDDEMTDESKDSAEGEEFEDEEEDDVEEVLKTSGIGSGDNKVDLKASKTDDPGKGKFITREQLAAYLSEILKEMDGEEKEEDGEEEEDAVKETIDYSGQIESLQKENQSLKEGVKKLHKEIKEMTVLNAKLLYCTKILNKFNLNESEKGKVLRNIDSANSLREVKLVYATISQNLDEAKKKENKKPLKESSVSSVSKSTAPKESIFESDELKNRFKKLANIKI